MKTRRNRAPAEVKAQTVKTFCEHAEWLRSHCRGHDQIVGRTLLGRTAGQAEAGSLVYRFGSLYHFLTEHGAAFRPHAKPHDAKYGTPKHCYHNCHKAVQTRSEYLYAEGLCSSADVPFPFWHAWLVHAKTGTAHEITIRREVPNAYLGVAFAHGYSRAAHLRGYKSECMALLDAWTERWPVLRFTPEDIATNLIAFRDQCPKGV